MIKVKRNAKSTVFVISFFLIAILPLAVLLLSRVEIGSYIQLAFGWFLVLSVILLFIMKAVSPPRDTPLKYVTICVQIPIALVIGLVIAGILIGLLNRLA